MKRASVFLILIAGGVLAGFVLKSNKKNEPVASNGQVNQPVETVTTIQDNVSTYDQTDETINENKQPTEEWKPPVQNEEPTIKEKDKGNEMLVTTQVKETNSKQQKSVIDPYQTSPGADIDNVTGERSKKERNNYTVEEQTETKTETKQNNSPKLASVKSNNYQRGAFGGIRNLELTVTNKSKYHLDKVVVELQYLKPSEEPLRSEKIVFRSIPAEGTSTIAVPPTNRGIKVVYKIINVESKELTDETAAMK